MWNVLFVKLFNDAKIQQLVVIIVSHDIVQIIFQPQPYTVRYRTTHRLSHNIKRHLISPQIKHCALVEIHPLLISHTPQQPSRVTAAAVCTLHH